MNAIEKDLNALMKLVEGETLLLEAELILERAMVLLDVAKEKKLSKALEDLHWKIYQARLLRNTALSAKKKEVLAQKSIDKEEGAE